MTLKLKICGMRESENIHTVAALSPEYMGFIFYKNSPRYVGDGFEIPASVHSAVKRVGVFVNESLQTLEALVVRHRLDLVQLHGDESGEYCKTLHKMGMATIKAFSIDHQFDFSDTKKYQAWVNYFLFDTKGKFRGGNAQVFDWSLLRHYNQEIPFFLSGGLSDKHLPKIQELAMNIHAIDVNSGVEISPGLKDVEKIKTIQSILRRTD